MKIYEIVEYVIKTYPDCMMAKDDTIVNDNNKYYGDMFVDDLLNFYFHEKIKLCGCGSPEDTYECIRQLLTIRQGSMTDKLNYQDEIVNYKTALNINIEDDMQNGLLQFMMYILDDCGILQHGNNIGGCWLTEEGEMLLTILNRWHELNKN